MRRGLPARSRLCQIGQRHGQGCPCHAQGRLRNAPVKTLIATLLVAATVAAAADKPNILVILADDLGYGELGCYGGKDVPTPHIDSLATNGIRFTDGYVSSSVCSPSRAGLMTGRYGVRFGIELNPGFSHVVGLPLSEKTMAELLKPAGYVTGMFGKWHLGFKPAMQPTGRGFDEYFGFLGGAHSYVDAEGDHDSANTILRGRQKVNAITYLTDDFGREAVAFIGNHTNQPWFVYLPFNATHGPLAAPEKYTGRFPGLQGGRCTFAGTLSALDDNVGLVLAKLRALGLEENTLIFFLSDNGAPDHGETSNSNRPLRGYKAQLLEGGIRIPFIVQWKGHLPAGRTDSRPVIALDILPTLLAAAGLGGQANLDGVNLLPFLAGDKRNLPHEALFWRYDGQRAVRMGDWKFLRMGRKTQLYNLAADIGEKTDLAGREPGKLKELEAAWQSWNETVRLFDIGNDPGMTHDVSAAHSDLRLRALAQFQKEVNTGG
jgi:arylsulfatase A-like enzyme